MEIFIATRRFRKSSLDPDTYDLHIHMTHGRLLSLVHYIWMIYHILSVRYVAVHTLYCILSTAYYILYYMYKLVVHSFDTTAYIYIYTHTQRAYYVISYLYFVVL